jgi:hypothetical protein
MTEFIWRCPKCKQILTSKLKKDLNSIRAKHYAGHWKIRKILDAK